MKKRTWLMRAIHRVAWTSKALLLLACLLFFSLATTAKSLGRLGSPQDTVTQTRPAYLLMGGSTDVDAAVAAWLSHAGGGDVVVLRASGSTGYNAYFLEKGKAHSVETLLLDSKEAALDPAMAQCIEKAEAIFIAGGDQWNYVHFWSGTPVQVALQKAIDKGIPLGGTSAGLAILGEFVFDAQFNSVTSAEALAQPQGEKISLTRHFLRIPILQNILTDSHYSQRDRMGRHVVFLLKAKDQFGAKAKGIGIDEKTALLLEPNGRGIIYGTAKAYFLHKAKNKPHMGVQYQALAGTAAGTPVVLRKVFRSATQKFEAPL